MSNLPEPKISQLRKQVKSVWDAPVLTGNEALSHIMKTPPIQIPQQAFRGGYATSQATKSTIAK